MNDPRTCVYAKPRAFGEMDSGPTCSRPGGAWCLCGLTPARLSTYDFDAAAKTEAGARKVQDRLFATGGFVPAPGPNSAMMMRDDPGLAAVVRPVDKPGEVTLYGGARGGPGKYGRAPVVITSNPSVPSRSWVRRHFEGTWEGTATGRLRSSVPHMEEVPRSWLDGDWDATVPAVLNLDMNAIEQRILADSGFYTPPEWDNWKPGRDVS